MYNLFAGQSSGYGHSNHGGGGYDFTPQHIHYHQPDYEEHGKGEKEISLSDLFEIALTAIAFLAFKCFLLQVILCLTQSVSYLQFTRVSCLET